MISLEVFAENRKVDGKDVINFPMIALMNRQHQKLVFLLDEDYYNNTILDDSDSNHQKERAGVRACVEKKKDDILVLGKKFHAEWKVLPIDQIVTEMLEFHKADDSFNNLILTTLAYDLGAFLYRANCSHPTEDHPRRMEIVEFMANLVDIGTLVKTSVPKLDVAFRPQMGLNERLYLFLKALEDDPDEE